jgi:uncharacterized protein (TIGR00251 family)
VKVRVAVKPNSRKESLEVLPDGSVLARVNAPPVGGKANERVIELLAKLFKVPKSRVELISGSSSKKKLFEIVDG